MRVHVPFLLVGVVAAATLAPGVAAPAEAAGAGKSCTGRLPSKVQIERVRGKAQARVTWRAPLRAGKRARYALTVNGRSAAAGTKRTRTVRIVVGRRVRIVVRLVGAARRCVVRKSVVLRAQAPTVPGSPAIGEVADDAVTLSWLRSKRGDGRLAGYRVTRNGATVRQTKDLKMRVKLPAGREHTLRVIAVDSRGRRSAASRAVKVTPGHTPPATPGDLRALGISSTSVGLQWSRAERASAYRVMRDGTPLFQTATPQAAIDNLAPSTGYAFTVAAVDSQGYLSAPTAPAVIRTADPDPTTGHAHAFLLASTDRSFEDLQANYRKVGVLYPTYFDCAPGGGIEGREDPLVTRWAQARRILVFPRFNCQSQSRLHQILTDPGTRQAVLGRLVELVDTHGYDGINIDFESGAAADRDPLTSFVAELSAQLHTRGKKVSVEVSAKTYANQQGRPAFYDYPKLGAAADWVFVMNWGKHWSTSAPGPMDDLPWATQVADYTATMPNKERYVLGFPLYGMDWANGGGPANPGVPLEYASMQKLIAQVGATPVHDPVNSSWSFSYTDGSGVRHDVHYGDATTFAVRVKMARDRGLLTGLWRLGEEDQRLWDLL